MTGPIGAGKTRALLAASGLLSSNHFDIVSTDLCFHLLVAPERSDKTVRFYNTAKEISRRRLFELGRQRTPIIWETVLASAWKWQALEWLRGCGYEVATVYVSTVDAEICVARADERARAGWHSVPRSKIVDRFNTMESAVPRLSEWSDRFVHLDNSSARFRLVGVACRTPLLPKQCEARIDQLGSIEGIACGSRDPCSRSRLARM